MALIPWLFSKGEYETAYRSLNSFRQNPYETRYLDGEFFSAAYVTGRRDVAYQVAVDEARRNYDYLDLALATATRGQVFPGELAFLEPIIAKQWQGLNRLYPVPPMNWDPSSRHDVLIASLLAEAARSDARAPLYRSALKLDPHCIFAVDGLLNCYWLSGQYRAYRSYVAQAVKDVRDTHYTNLLLKSLSQIEGKPDVPLPAKPEPLAARYGLENPPPP